MLRVRYLSWWNFARETALLGSLPEEIRDMLCSISSSYTQPQWMSRYMHAWSWYQYNIPSIYIYIFRIVYITPNCCWCYWLKEKTIQDGKYFIFTIMMNNKTLRQTMNESCSFNCSYSLSFEKSIPCWPIFVLPALSIHAL